MGDWTYDELREEYEVLKDECAALRDENDELRVSYDTLKRIATEQLTVYAKHEQSWRDENAKLRKLVRDLYGLAWPECPGAAETYLPRIQSLGIEVD